MRGGRGVRNGAGRYLSEYRAWCNVRSTVERWQFGGWYGEVGALRKAGEQEFGGCCDLVCDLFHDGLITERMRERMMARINKRSKYKTACDKYIWSPTYHANRLKWIQEQIDSLR